MSENAPTPVPATASPATTPAPNLAIKAVSLLWLIASIIIGLTIINGTRMVVYGGDAYTGIQNAAAHTTVAVGWVIIGTGVIAFVNAWRRN